MSNRSEYLKQYRLENKEILKEKRRQRKKEKQEDVAYQKTLKETKLQILKDELEKTIRKNTWFDPNRIPYLNKLPGHKNARYQKGKEKRFNLQYDINHFYERVKGDSKKYMNQRFEAYTDFCREEDIKHRIIYWVIFRNACLKRTGREPDFTDSMVNSVLKPEEIIPNHEDYRPDLVYLLDKEYDIKYNYKPREDVSSDGE